MLEETNQTSESPVILALDTSSKQTSLAVARGSVIIATFCEGMDEKRSERLWAEIDQLIKRAGITFSDIDLFSVCLGPGGFTGLRVGIAAVKGFAFASNKPTVGVGSLEGIAFASGQEGTVCAVKSAYRGDVYAQMFDCVAGAIPAPLMQPIVALPAEVSRLIDEARARAADREGAGEAARKVVVVSDPAGVDDTPASTNELFSFTDVGVVSSMAESIARIGYLRFVAGGAVKAGELQALYVRPSDAEIKLSKGLLGVKHRIDVTTD